MDIEQQIDLIKQRANFPRPGRFHRIANTLEGGSVPYPIDVFILVERISSLECMFATIPLPLHR